MSDEREPLWSDTEIAEIIAGMASKWEAAILYSILRGKRDAYEARIAELEAQLANQYQRIERFVELVDQLEAQLKEGIEANAECARFIADQIDQNQELEARLAQTWQPLPDGEYGNVMVARNGEVLSVLERDGLLDESFWSGRFIADNIRLCRLVERDEPQPDWSSAPEWAQWWFVDADGEVIFWQNKPDVIYIRGMWYDDGECLVACDLDLPIGIDWRTTLRQRPTEDSHE